MWGIMWGSIIRVAKGDTRSLDYTSYAGSLTKMGVFG